MIMQLVVALAAGCASALMFVSVVSGALISLVLFYLAPLPLLVAALGWGSTTALAGGLVTCAAIGLILGLPYMTVFALTVALPAWWLGRLTMLARSAPGPDGTSVLHWYPPGRLVLWTAAFASLTTIAALLSLGSDAATVTDTLKHGLARIFGATEGTDAADTDVLVTVLVTIAPAAATMVTMAALALNLWLGARIAQTSGRLTRPWPALNLIEFPTLTLAVLAVAILLSLAGGLLALCAQVVSTALVLAYAIAGFAVLHSLTQSMATRGFWLAGTYALVVVFGWPLVVVALLGIADAVFGFRRRRRLTPPTPSF
ncbi:MAG: DUF2232 domain-containing protein [Xanthobacteraceae bacterium]|nr:DUF2232 domain-containing protein [Xanthobacteraceae bacterium]